MSLLTIVQETMVRMKLTEPTNVTNSTDPQVNTIVALINGAGRAATKSVQWQNLIVEYIFTALGQEEQTDLLPADFANFVNETFFNRSRIRPVIGPLTPNEWQTQRSLFRTLVYDHFRLRGNQILMLPAPAAGDELVFEYITENWVLKADTTFADKMTVNEDLSRIDEEIIILDAIWRFKAANGLQYAEAKAEWWAYLQNVKAKEGDGGRRIISLGGSFNVNNPRQPYIPEGSWNVP